MYKLNPLWHPCSQMKDYEDFPPLRIRKAYGSFFELEDGKTLIDAISSWWCKSLGHNHPRLKTRLITQAEQFEHVILANTTNHTIAQLSQQLTQLTTTLKKIFYASDGSCAVEIALKMSLHAQLLQGATQRKNFMALQHAYHGETMLALAVSDIGLYRKPYETCMPKVKFLEPIPYVHSIHDPLWQDCGSYWPLIEAQLEQHAPTLAAIIIEPIVQGAAGMRIYSQDFLKRLRLWTAKHGIHLIADEIMTGMGRTGYPLACQHAAIEPDFLCLGKGLTSGWLPLSAVLTSQAIYDIFYDDYEAGKSFLHSHTFSGNVLAAAVASECLTMMAEENICHQVQTMAPYYLQYMQEVAEHTQKIHHIRHIGAIAAADLCVAPHLRMGYQVFLEAVKLGALLRPLGNTIYWLLPLNADLTVLKKLRDITIQAIQQAFK